MIEYPDAKWLALYTRSRHEKFVQNELAKRHIESYLPVRKIKKRWSDRTVTLEEPLFKSYLFVKTNPLKLADVLQTKGAVTFVRAGKDPFEVQPKVIEDVRRLVSEEMAIDSFPYLKEGSRVVVKNGIFAGIEGFVLRKDSKRCRLVISIDALQASISIEVDSCLVETV